MLILSITQAIADALRSLMLSICEIVYWLIKFFFEIFQLLGTASLLNNDTIQEVYRRIGLILGLFMLFRLVFSTIQYVINPDLLLDKSKGAFNIVKRMIIVVVLLGITPFLFNFAFDFQELIVTEKVIPKLITGKSSGSSDEFGGDLAWYTFSTFFKKSEYADENFCPELLTSTGSYGSFMEKEFMQKGTLRTAFNCVNQTKNIDVNGEETTVYLMEFKGYGLLAVLVGCILLWVIIIYTIQVGVRVIQLAYLQLIAPIPIMMYLDPKGDDKLKKWFSQCTTTYFDFFIRTAIMYLVVYVIDLLISGTDDNHFLNSIDNPGGIEETYIIIIMIIALLIFAKKAPALFKEIFPSSGGAAKFDFGIKSPKQAWNDYVKDPITGIPVAGKAIGWMGKKVSTAVSAPVKRKVDTFNQNRKNRIEGRQEARANASKYKQGTRLFETFGDDLTGAFESDFAITYNQVKTAKDNVKVADADLRRANDELAAAYNSGDSARVSTALTRYNVANENSKKANKQLDMAKAAHEVNRKRYTSSAKKEDAYNYYNDMNKLNGISKNGSIYPSSSASNVNSNTNSSSSNSSSSSTAAPNIVLPQETAETAYNEMLDAINNGEDQSVIDEKIARYNQLEGKVQEINNQIDDADADFRDSSHSVGRADNSDNW